MLPPGPSLVPIPVPRVRPILRRTLKRCLRLLPSVLLLLFVISLIFVTLMQIAVIHAHRRSMVTQRANSSTAVTTSGVTNVNVNQADLNSYGSNNVINKANIGSNPAEAKRQEVLRIEALLDRKSPSLETNAKMVQNFVNSVRIKDILDFADNRKKKLLTQQLSSPQNGSLLGLPVDSVKESPTVRNSSGLPLKKGKYFCPLVPPNLIGRIDIQLHPKAEFSLNPSQAWTSMPKTIFGGHWEPLDCYSQHRVAIIIPYRDRREHLFTLLYHLHPILQRQLLDYKIYVIEQFGNETFNKGVLMNAGVKEALKENDFHCFVFHDVDMIPEDDRNLYSCPSIPRHMSVAVDKFNYSLPYSYLVGGVFAISKEHFILVNGYSNLYWGWGGEDDDMAHRLKFHNLHITRPPESIGRYKMIKHSNRAESPSNVRYALLRMAKRRAARDGLSSVRYKIIYRQAEVLYTHLIIEIGQIHKWQFPSKNKLVLHF